MNPSENAGEENRRLRRTMRDMVALSTLPAVWAGLDPEGIALSLADVLFATLSLDLIYIGLPGLTSDARIEVVRGTNYSGPGDDAAVAAALAPLLQDDLAGSPSTIANPLGTGTLHTVVTRFGIGSDQGVLVAASRNVSFPQPHDRLLLGVGANQTAIVVQRRRAEEQMRAQQDLLRVTLASIGDAVIATDTQGQVTFLNGVAEELTGWIQEEAKGRPLETVFVIVNDQTRQPVENPVDKVLRTGTIVGLADTTLVARNGVERPIDDSAAPIMDNAGQMIGVVLTFRDVTKQRKADRALREREQELRLVTDYAPAFLAHCDREARYKFVNKGYAERFGMAPQDLVGQRIADVLGEKAYANLARHVEAALAGKPVEFEVEIPYERIGPHIVHGAYAPEFDAAGRVDGFVAVITDVTERKRAEDALRASEQRFARFMQHLPGLAWIKDSQGRYVYANDAAEKAFCTPRADLYGKTDAEVFPPEIAARFSQNDLQAVASGSGVQVVETLEHEDGTLHYSLVTKFPIQRPDGEVAYVGGMAIDITDRKRAEEKVRHSEERFRSLMEQAPFSIQVFSPDGRTIRVNRAWEELWGVRFEQIDGYNILEDRQLAAKGILQHIHQGFAGQATRIPAIQYNPNDTIPDITQHDDPSRWLSAVIYPLKDDEGQVREVVLIHDDITARKRAEEKSQRSEAQSRTILESITDAFCALDRDWRFTYVNRQAEVLLGRSRDDLIGKNHWSEYPDTVGTDFEQNYRRAVRENVTATFEHFYPPHDRWYECHAYPSPEGLSVYFRDVSERKRAELVLSESEKRFRQLADAMPQIVWTAKPEGNIDYLNQRWTEFSGLPASVSNEAWGPMMHPEEAEQASARWAESVRRGSPFEMEMRLWDRRQQTYCWHLLRTVPVKDAAGKVSRWFGTGTDIDQQKRAEQASRFLAEASAELAGLVDHESTLNKVANLAVPYFADWSAVDLVSGDGELRRLAVAHQDLDKVALVQEIMREYPPDRQSPTGVYAVLRSGKPELVRMISDDILLRAARDDRHLYLIRSLGLRSYICVPMIVSGKTLGLLTFATAESGRVYTEADLALAIDLSNRAAVAVENTQLYQALRDADRRKDEFLATLAHELRNPLAPVRNALQILKMPRVDAETIERSREMMERQVQHLVRLVDDLMDVSRVMRGKIELRRERVELATIVARAVETVQPLVDAQGHDLSVQISSESLLLDADPVRLAQVVGNLVTNAAKYTEPNGRIWVTAERDGDMAALRVRDSGIGIASPMLPRIFDLFVQVDHASTRAQGGLGIGLTLVKNLVEMHNGTVEALSEGLGRGSEFIVRLPVVVSDPLNDLSSQRKLEANRVPVPSGHRLLVVDDNQDAANSLAMLLKLQGHEVRVAFSGMGAVEMTKTYTPDVVFMDIGMPGMDGYEAARRIREQPGLGKVVMAALTGWGQQEDRRRTAEAGFNHHLVKPPDPNALEKVLSDLKRGRR